MASGGGAMPAKPTKPTLFDVKISNNGARVRLVAYWKDLENSIDFKAPADVGGLRSEAFLALNPEGKMPVLQLPSGVTLPESEVIVQFLLHAYPDKGRSLQPADPEARARCALVARIIDLYICSIQGCMYKAGIAAEERAKQIGELAKQLDILEGIADDQGPFICGPEPTFADAAFLPTIEGFCHYILPSIFGWDDIYQNRPRLQRAAKALAADPCALRVRDELHSALDNWKQNGRWEDGTGIKQQINENPHLRWKY